MCSKRFFVGRVLLNALDSKSFLQGGLWIQIVKAKAQKSRLESRLSDLLSDYRIFNIVWLSWLFTSSALELAWKLR